MAADKPMLKGGEERSHEEQPPSNGSQPSRTFARLPDLNSSLTEIPSDDDYLPDSKSNSDDEEYGDEDRDDGDEDIMQELAQVFITRELAILMTWMEELRREILKIREELRILQKKLGLDGQGNAGDALKSSIKSLWGYVKRGLKSVWSRLKVLAFAIDSFMGPAFMQEGRRYSVHPARFY